MYTDDTRTKVNFVPMFFQMDLIGYNAGKIPAVNNELSWGELFNPKWRGKVAMFGIDWRGMLNAAMGMRALSLLNPVDISNMTEKEVDTVTTFLKEKKKEGHFRAMWKAYGELVNLMASEEVWIADCPCSKSDSAMESVCR
jgi:putative spermidine/putrescine transport system substrate-binding protein